MQYLTAKLLIILYFFCSLMSFAATKTPLLPTDSNINKLPTLNTENYKNKTIIIVDMGSTGTRMHAYNIEKSLANPINHIPSITKIATAKSDDKKAVASFCDNPVQVNTHISPIYKRLKTELTKENININNVYIYFLATAGMRLKPEAQQFAVHQALKNSIIELGHNPDKIMAKTIPGKQEGIFDWLSVNYKLGTLQNKKPTVAALDMGGASTQVAMEYLYNKNKNVQDVFTLKFAEHTYHIYSKSILGYGLSQTKKNIKEYDSEQSAAQCSIHNKPNKDYLYLDKFEHHLGFDVNKQTGVNADNFNIKQPVQGYINQNTVKYNDFDYHNCTKLIKSYLNNKKEHLAITKAIKNALKNKMQLMAVSGYYYNFKFFKSQSPEDLIKTIPDTCHSHRKEFKKMFPNISEEELNETCFDATYLKILLNTGYNIPENYSNFVIPKHDIDWTIGAALFIAR